MLGPAALYASYIVVSLVLVIWVGQTLFSNGALFLRDVFHGDEELAAAVNRLLLVGFYLVNLGFVLLTSSIGADAADAAGQYKVITMKLGGVSLILGVMHFVNLSALNRARFRRVMERRPFPPQPPQPVPAGPAPTARPVR